MNLYGNVNGICHSRSHIISEFWIRFICKIGYLVYKTLIENFFGYEPISYFHQGEKVFWLAIVTSRIELGAVKVELIEVSLNLFAVGNEGIELNRFERTPLEEGH